jgi:ABC-2 type transport system permease protein
MNMRETLVIARRELLERVRSRWFVLITLLGPFATIALILLPPLIAGRGTDGTKLDIVDETGVIAPAIEAFLETQERWVVTVRPSTDLDLEIEQARLRSKTINGYLHVPKDALVGGTFAYRGDNATRPAVNLALVQAITGAVIRQRARQHDLSDLQVAALVNPPRIDARLSNGETEGRSGKASFLFGYMVAFVLYWVITMYGVAVMRAVVQEKTSRVMELMVATVKPRSLMAGKVLGVGTAGLLQITVWLTVAAVTMTYRDTILGWFGVASGGSALPSLAFAEIAIFVLYFIVGHFFYASLYAAAGAIVSSEQDTQQVQMPIAMVLMISVVWLQMVNGDPRGSAAGAVTMVPFWSPILMPMRYVLGGASLGEVAVSLSILLLATALVARAAARVYRVGILMYGKRPTLRELVRWLRH